MCRGNTTFDAFLLRLIKDVKTLKSNVAVVSGGSWVHEHFETREPHPLKRVTRSRQRTPPSLDLVLSLGEHHLTSTNAIATQIVGGTKVKLAPNERE